MTRATRETQRLFELLLEPCRRPLWTFVLRLVRDRELAEDLYQETLLRAWRALPGYRERGRFQSWLFRVAHNVVRDDGRRRTVRPSLVPMADLPEVPDDVRASDRVLSRETRERVLDRLSTLTEEQRAVFLLRIHSDLTFREIAELIGCPLSTVLGRMRDALRKLDEAREMS